MGYKTKVTLYCENGPPLGATRTNSAWLVFLKIRWYRLQLANFVLFAYPLDVLQDI